ncbi:MAG: alpha/beta hydrolase [Microbacterium sp.]|uniref:alpha/beta fold hydrolase n=1 Tax=Microbacterium sp. TaxID=51671 RepID=UPI00324237EA
MKNDEGSGRYLTVEGQQTWVEETGSGDPVLLLHGSGPGVSAAANWRSTIPALAARGFRAIAPDQLGFGRTVTPESYEYSFERWVAHALGVLDELGVESAHLVGNSFGGAIALRIAARHPERVRRLVLMGAVGVPFRITEALDRVWGYTPSVDEMEELMRVFSYDSSRFGRDLAEQRYLASIEGGADSRFAAMFPAPRQRWVDAMATPFAEIVDVRARTLLIHGLEDRVIPVETTLTLARLIPDARVQLFSRCGHWTQLERADEFNEIVGGFFSARVE